MNHSATILPFPQTARALRHRKEGMGAAGICALTYLEIEPPANVELFQEHRPAPDLASASPETAMFLAFYATLTNGQRNDIRMNLKRMARNGDSPSARAALDFLEWADRPRIKKLD